MPQTFEERVKTQMGGLLFTVLQQQQAAEQLAADLEAAKQKIAELEVIIAVLAPKESAP